MEDSFEPSRNIPIDEDYWVQHLLGSEYAPAYYPGVAQVRRAQVVPVKPGYEIQADVLMHRVRTVEVAGHIIDPSGSTANAFVRLEPVDGNDSGLDRQDTPTKRATSG